MRVNSTFNGFFNNRLVVGSGIALVMISIFLVATSFTKRTDRDLLTKEVNISIRKIGHRLLLQAGDSTSRVLPVTEIKEGVFQLRFEERMIFSHDSLMALSQRLLPKTKFPAGYTVTVQDCKLPDIIYGFQINNNTPDILACNGRREPPGCYIIEFAFEDFYKAPANYAVISLVCSSGILLFTTVALLLGRYGKNSPMLVQKQDNTIIKETTQKLSQLGKFLFDVKNQRLMLESEVITLTDKECKILELLNANFGELTPRETLMQVWIDEGVITSRSLDMFVSKLRKKLSSDPELRITNVHGKGYKLEIAK